MFRSFKIYIDEVFKHFIAPKDVLELLSLKVCFLGLHYKAHCRVMKEIIDLLSAEKEEQTWQHMHSGVLYQCTGPTDTTQADRRTDWTIVQNLNEEASVLFHSLKDCMKIKFTETPDSSETIAEAGQASKHSSLTLWKSHHIREEHDGKIEIVYQS